MNFKLTFKKTYNLGQEHHVLEANEMMPRAAASIDRWPKGQIPYTMATNLSNLIHYIILNRQQILSRSCHIFSYR